MWIYVVYSQGPETLHNGTPKMYVTFFTPRGGKTVVILQDNILKMYHKQTGKVVSRQYITSARQ